MEIRDIKALISPKIILGINNGETTNEMNKRKLDFFDATIFPGGLLNASYAR